jgi:hypothetical protein
MLQALKTSLIDLIFPPRCLACPSRPTRRTGFAPPAGATRISSPGRSAANAAFP